MRRYKKKLKEDSTILFHLEVPVPRYPDKERLSVLLWITQCTNCKILDVKKYACTSILLWINPPAPAKIPVSNPGMFNCTGVYSVCVLIIWLPSLPIPPSPSPSLFLPFSLSSLLPALPLSPFSLLSSLSSSPSPSLLPLSPPLSLPFSLPPSLPYVQGWAVSLVVVRARRDGLEPSH